MPLTWPRADGFHVQIDMPNDQYWSGAQPSGEVIMSQCAALLMTSWLMASGLMARVAAAVMVMLVLRQRRRPGDERQQRTERQVPRG